MVETVHRGTERVRRERVKKGGKQKGKVKEGGKDGKRRKGSGLKETEGKEKKRKRGMCHF